jgi:hypothetical protein
MNRALIFVALGTGLFFDDDYDKDNHWRFTKPERTYDTCAIVYNDFEPEPGTYDYIIRRKGLKWNIIEEASKIIKWEDYDYIGCFDDDFATDIQSVNEALAIARHYDFGMFHQAVTSWSNWPLMQHNPELFYTQTDFIECGMPFFRNDNFRKLLRLLADYKFKKGVWGLDLIWCQYLQTTAYVIHKNTVKHMRPDESTYDHSEAYQEMEYLTKEFFPKYMTEKLGYNYEYKKSVEVLRAWKIQDNSE